MSACGHPPSKELNGERPVIRPIPINLMRLIPSYRGARRLARPCSRSSCETPFFRQLTVRCKGVSPLRSRAFTAAAESGNVCDPYVSPPGSRMKSCCPRCAATPVDVRSGLHRRTYYLGTRFRRALVRDAIEGRMVAATPDIGVDTTPRNLRRLRNASIL
jgi:hypothetical protein